MKRRDFVKYSCLAGAAIPTARWSSFLPRAGVPDPVAEPLRVLHITDVHIRPEEEAPRRCETLLERIRQDMGRIDFVLNTGDSIYAADYDDITRERMLLQWDLWDSVVKSGLDGLEIFSCLGNHDSWWAAPTEDDPMRGKDYAVTRLGIPGRYYAFNKGPWRFFSLDGNNEGFLDEEQRQWFNAEVAALPDDQPVLIMSHQPVLNYSSLWDGMAEWQKEIVDPLHDIPRSVNFISGHIHELDSLIFRNLRFYCNGALSGFWWEPGPENDGSQRGTPIGYAVLELYPNGRMTCEYHGFTRDELLR